MSPTRRTVTSGLLAGVAGLVGLGTAGASTQSSDGTTISHEGERLTLDAAPGQVVRGRTEFAAGVGLTVRLRSAGSSPFLLTTETTVAEDGTFEATFDLSEVDPGTSFTATVLWHSFEQASVDGTVGAVNPRISIDYEGQVLTLAPAEEQSVTGSAELPEGTSLNLRLRSNGSSPFIRSAEPTVGPDGAFETTFDLSSVESGSFALLEAYWDGSRRTFAIVEVAE